MISLLVSIIALGIIITIHEFGHFLAARAMGIGVIEFSIGMGPRICSKVIGNVRYSLRIMPFGGSCMMLGEELDESEYLEDEDDCGEAGRECGSSDDAENEAFSESEPCKKEEVSRLKAAQFNNGSLDSFERSEDEDSFIVDGRRYPKDSQFISKPAWRRFIVIAAGPVFNFVLAFLLSVIICGCYGFDRPTVIEVQPGGPVAEAGIEPGDEIYALKVGKTKMSIQSARDISIFNYVHSDEIQAAETFTVYYRDADDGMNKSKAELVPYYDNEKEVYRFGYAYNIAYDKTKGIIDTLKCSQYNVNYCIRSSFESLRLIARGKVTGKDVMGPVRMVAVMDETVSEAADYGLKSSVLTLLDLMILISGSLGFMNLLPIPALDGGRLVFIIIELITRRAVPKELEAKIHTCGMLLLLGFMLLIMMNDISMLILPH